MLSKLAENRGFFEEIDGMATLRNGIQEVPGSTPGGSTIFFRFSPEPKAIHLLCSQQISAVERQSVEQSQSKLEVPQSGRKTAPSKNAPIAPPSKSYE